MAIRNKIKFRTPISPDVISMPSKKSTEDRGDVIDKLKFKQTKTKNSRSVLTSQNLIQVKLKGNGKPISQIKNNGRISRHNIGTN